MILSAGPRDPGEEPPRRFPPGSHEIDGHRGGPIRIPYRERRGVPRTGYHRRLRGAVATVKCGKTHRLGTGIGRPVTN